MTIDDAVNLVGHLTSASTVEDALSAFQADRKKRDEDTVKEARKMGKLQQIHSPLVSWLRDEAFEHAPPDKMRQVAEEMAKG
jgi:2-polyprenyl-6-methoxyphenol hydroxylase-like FAD-dependent oxidoreductase